jgi:hypothetical protein
MIQLHCPQGNLCRKYEDKGFITGHGIATLKFYQICSRSEASIDIEFQLHFI